MSSLRFVYGAGFVQIDVTKQAIESFINGNQLNVPKDASFNDIFGDVIPNEQKTLLILFEDKTFISLPEIRTRNLVVTISSE